MPLSKDGRSTNHEATGKAMLYLNNPHSAKVQKFPIKGGVCVSQFERDTPQHIVIKCTYALKSLFKCNEDRYTVQKSDRLYIMLKRDKQVFYIYRTYTKGQK